MPGDSLQLLDWRHTMHRSKTRNLLSKNQNLHRTRPPLTGCLGRPGGHCGEPAPDPIPNSAVKTPSAYDTTSQDVGKSVAPGLPMHPTQIIGCRKKYPITAGWSSPVARQAHNLKVVGSNPTPATTDNTTSSPSVLVPPLARARRVFAFLSPQPAPAADKT